MFKRIVFIAPLALALTACGSSGHNNAPATMTANPTTTSQGAAAATPAAATPATATSSAVASTTAPASATSAASMAAATQTPAANASGSGPIPAASTNGLSAAEKAAMVKAAHTFAPSSQWVKGKNYFVIQPPQPKATSTHKIEVLEVFNWGCPACNAAHTFIDKMEAQLPSYATMAYLPAGFRPDENWVLYQRAWLTAKALGVAKKSYNAMFESNWTGKGVTGSYDLATGRLNPRSKWPHMQQIAEFYHKKYGIPVKKFIAVSQSFAVNTKLKRADKLVKAYGVPGTPTIIIDGRYRFGFQSAGSYAKGIALAKYLVAKEAHRIVSQEPSGK